MTRRAWWLSAAALLIGVPGLAVAAALAMVDPNALKPHLAAAVEAATGRTLGLAGPLRISRSLWPTIEASDVTLANLPGGSRPDMARAERIEAQLSLPALLLRRIEVVHLTLVGPNILFELVSGKPNWVFDDAPPAAPAGPPQLRFRSVHVRDGMVTWRLPARTKVVGIRALDYRQPVQGGPLELATELVYGDYQPFTLHAKAQPGTTADAAWATQLAFAAYDARATAEGTMDLAGHYDMQVAAQAPALEKLNALLPDMRLPPLRRASLATHLANGAVPGDLPAIGATTLHVDSADLGASLAGLKLGAVDVTLPEPGSSATIAASGTLAGAPFSLAGTAGVPQPLDGKAAVPVDLVLHPGTLAGGRRPADSLTVRGKLTLSAGRFQGLDARIALRAPALTAWRPLLSPALPALTEVALDGRMILPASLATLQMQGASLSAAEGDLAGDAKIGLGPALAVQGTLHANRIDLDALLGAFGAAPAGAASRAADDASQTLFPDTPLPWATLRGPAVDLAAQVAALTFRRHVWPAIDLALHLKGGQLQISLPAGPVDLALTADASADDAPVRLKLRAAALPLALVARHAGLPGPVSGALKVDMQMQAAGRSVRALAASLHGSLAATLVDGSLSNAALVKLAGAALDALGASVPAQGTTAIRCLGLVGDFDRGVGRFKTIALSTTYLELAGAGEVDLAAQTLALKLHPLAHLSGSEVSVPVVVEGPLNAPRGRLDASGLDQLGLLIDAWFGGDTPQTCSDAGLVPP